MDVKKDTSEKKDVNINVPEGEAGNYHDDSVGPIKVKKGDDVVE